MSNLLIVIRKELKRVFDDRRLVFTTFILPAVSIALIYSIMGSMIGNMTSDIKSHVPSVYIQNAPADFQTILADDSLKERMELTTVPQGESLESVKSAIQDGTVDLLVVFPEDFSAEIEDYRSNRDVPVINTYYNTSEDYSRNARNILFEGIFKQYENMIIGERLGGSHYANAFDVDKGNTQSVIVDERKATGKGLSTLLPMLIVIFLFSGGMGIGMDTIAGEKERGTMATLLITPVKRETIAFGKIIGLGIVSIISAASSFLGVIISLPFSSVIFGSRTGSVNLGALNFGAAQYLQLSLIMLTLVGVFVGLIALTSIIAKNVKEAGTYVVPIYMLVMVSGFLNMFTTGTPTTVRYAIPVYGSVVAIKSLLEFELAWLNFGLCCLINVAATAMLIWVIKKMFNSEKIMFGI